MEASHKVGNEAEIQNFGANFERLKRGSVLRVRCCFGGGLERYAPYDAAHECVLKEVGESGSCLFSMVCLLQLL